MKLIFAVWVVSLSLVVEVRIAGTEEPQSNTPDPVAHWKLNDEGDTAQDAAGGHHGRIIGAQSVSGKIGKALLFNRAQGNHVRISYFPDFDLSSFTVAAWVKLTQEPTFSGILGTRFGSEHSFDMKVNDTKVHGDIGDGKRWIETKVNFYAKDAGSNGEGGDLDLDRWYHIVYAVDDNAHQCHLYLDSDLKKMISFEGHPRLMKPGQTMCIGNSFNDEFMDGMIDDVQIWRTALTPAQVMAVHAAGIHAGEQDN